MWNLILAFAVALSVTALLTPLAIKLAPKIGAMDIPKDSRRMHKNPIPRLGGPGIYIGILVSVLLFAPRTTQITGLLISSALIVILGYVDDRKNLKAVIKLIGQIICAFIICGFDVRVRGVGELVFPLWLSIIITVLWIVGITNTINLIDGLDGLAGGIVCIACLSVAYTCKLTNRNEVEIIALAIAGAAVGFLIFNMYPAKIFMGDAGSMLFGFMLASISLIGDNPTKSTTLFATFIPIVILALPLFDTAFAIVRRVYNHKPIMQADKGHIHHRIMAMGFGQRRTVLALYCISAVMGVAGILFTASQRLAACLLVVIAICLVVIFLGVGIVDKKIEEPAKPAEGESPAEPAAAAEIQAPEAKEEEA